MYLKPQQEEGWYGEEESGELQEAGWTVREILEGVGGAVVLAGERVVPQYLGVNGDKEDKIRKIRKMGGGVRGQGL